MPKLWHQTMAAHRRGVRDAILHTAAALVAWHDQHVAEHLERLAAARERVADPGERLAAVLETYALQVHARPHGTELASVVHRGEHFARAQHELHGFVRDLLVAAAAAG